MSRDDINQNIKTVSYLVCEQFLIRQVATHGRPIYRSSLGDIQIGVSSLQNFLISYYSAGDMSDLDIAMHFFSMLNAEVRLEYGAIVSMSSQYELTALAINEISNLLEDLAEMEMEMACESVKHSISAGHIH
ncbi:TPA: hypothetical protein U2M37_000105 [Providencia stuartii]|uniref:hypothetical protein n=1 Tax=Providencia stuartii TaxID=588 RepID=UPI0018C4B00C|nr:hypothetical protein [Providencia stuartii]MBG5911060.1 hypothetical protein [Providencia stuartii]MBG5917695.1 hypothetical protein [Providencia stuartii]HEM6851957.1 hypothetical protein [Providencia stuartii]HEM8169858.1 hypothetical protein [Providencia stuartii]HEM8191924.1 hypothetical protein [Providencia stuartii]